MSFPEINRCSISFPDSWNKPKVPAYGTFPWPHITSERNYEQIARDMKSIVVEALMIGFWHIDTAFSYKNQDLVGKAIIETQIPRDKVFITSKLLQHHNSYSDAIYNIKEGIHQIWGDFSSTNIAYLDSFLLHYPGRGKPLDAWTALLEARGNQIVHHIGVSNFDIWHIDVLRRKSGEKPEINQIEFHPWIYHKQRPLLQYCHEEGIAVEGYSPLAQGVALNHPLIQQIATTNQTTPARIVLKWCMQHGVRPIVGSINPEHLKNNAEPYNFHLNPDEMHAINDLGKNNSIRISEQWNWNPQKATFGNRTLFNSLLRNFHKFRKF